MEHQYDIRRLERTILTSRVYQLASEMNESNKLDRLNRPRANKPRGPSDNDRPARHTGHRNKKLEVRR